MTEQDLHLLLKMLIVLKRANAPALPGSCFPPLFTQTAPVKCGRPAQTCSVNFNTRKTEERKEEHERWKRKRGRTEKTKEKQTDGIKRLKMIKLSRLLDTNTLFVLFTTSNIGKVSLHHCEELK